MADFDNSEKLDDDDGCYGNEPRILTDPGKRSAARDGFTQVARRVRGDLPGEVTETERADERERQEADFDQKFGPIAFGRWPH